MSKESKITKKAKQILPYMRWYGPYLGGGIKVKSFSDDLTEIVVQLKLTWFNKNLYGTHFGGSLYSMVDPFFLFILLNNLGKDYIIWDKTASIDYKKPGKGKVLATVQISQEEIQGIREEIAIVKKKVYSFSVDVIDEEGDVVATITKGVYVRAKETQSLN